MTMDIGAKTIICQKCSSSFKVDFNKAPKDLFTVACPKCGQKYQLKKPGPKPAQTASSAVPDKSPPPPLDDRVPKASDPAPQLDLKAFNPRAGWQYNLYRYTRAVPYAKNITLPLYGSMLVSSIVRLVQHQVTNGTITPAAYNAMKANMAATCSIVYSTSIAPELSELGIPRFMQKPFAARFTRSLAEQLSSSVVSITGSRATQGSHRGPAWTGSPSNLTSPVPTPEPSSATPVVPTISTGHPAGSQPASANSVVNTMSASMSDTQGMVQRRPVPIAMWILGGLMLIACFLPWIEMRGSWDLGIGGRGSMLMGEASGTSFWQGQLCLVLLIGSLVAKQFRQRAIAGICAILVPLLAIHFVMQMAGAFGHSSSVSFMGHHASSSLRADPSIGSMAVVVLSIPVVILAFLNRKSKVLFAPSTPVLAQRRQQEVPTPTATVRPPVQAPIPEIALNTPPVERRSAKPLLIAISCIVLLGLATWWFLDLRHRHTLTAEERARAEGWFANLRNGQWVLMPQTGPVRQEYAIEYDPVRVSADKYGLTTIRMNIELRSISAGGVTRYGAVEERPHTDLTEPTELWLADGNGVPGEGTSILLRRITADSMEVEFRNEEGLGEVLAGVPERRFNMLLAAAETGQRLALVHALDSIAQGTGLVRRGIFHSYACGEECGATFMESRNGTVVPITYVCNNNRFGDIQLSEGDMLGTGDFTNKNLVGQRFLVVSKLVTIPGHEGGPGWAVQGLLPDEGENFPELDQRLALSANFDAGAGTSMPGTSATDASGPVSFLDDSDIHEAKDLQQQPEFPGGMDKMYAFMNSTMKYPDAEYEAGIQGKVYVQFTVSRDGSIRDAKVLRSVSEGLDREAVRIVKSMPRWVPGSLDGSPVNCRFNLPITFRLQ